MKKILFLILLVLLFQADSIHAAWPAINWAWLPWAWWWDDAVVNTYIPKAIATLIKYTSVIAVLSVTISGIMYNMSFWDEAKAKKAKAWITYSLVWVLVSTSAYAIISLVNSISLK